MASLTLAKAREATDALFTIVRPEFLYHRPLRERHRIIFYVGHLEAFDWNVSRLHFPELESFAPALDQLFALGIDPVEGQLPSDVPADWPNRAEVSHYCQTVRDRLDAVLAVKPCPPGLLDMLVEHRWMHAETLSYMLHQMPWEQKLPQGQPTLPSVSAPEHSFVPIPAGPARLGREAGAGFGWDNEFAAHSVEVPAFAISRYKVTNAQYLNFVEAGGYQNSVYWRPEDWQWVQREQVQHPAFWIRQRGSWLWRGIFEAMPLPPHWPVYVSQAEAQAYARWAGLRLPTEAEFHRAAYGESGEYPWGNVPPGPEHAYFDMQRWDGAPVNAFPAAKSKSGVDGLLSTGWEWTSTLFAPFAGFQPSPDYLTYSANFFDGKHYVLKGGSPRTEQSMLRPSFRNWFQPHYPYVYAGFRCVEESGARYDD